MAKTALPTILKFDEAYFERIWGGNRLRARLGKSAPADRPIGEAWLLSDHPVHQSRVAEGPLQGASLGELLATYGSRLLGSRVRPTHHGRFPLLLKILDAQDVLSIQVHPDDETAAQLGEPDVGKTEMWHVLEHEPGAQLICGLKPGVTPASFERAIQDGSVEDLLVKFPVEPGDSVFVPAGTVHAIGAGILLTEIQQNSDITYRVYDFGRIGPNGQSRELHIEKSLKATKFGSHHRGKTMPLRYDATRQLLAVCRYFAAELVTIPGRYARDTRGDSFHIVMALNPDIKITTPKSKRLLTRGEAVLVSGECVQFELSGCGQALVYYVPNLQLDILKPLLEIGYTMNDLLAMSGSTDSGDLTFDP